MRRQGAAARRNGGRNWVAESHLMMMLVFVLVFGVAFAFYLIVYGNPDVVRRLAKTAAGSPSAQGRVLAFRDALNDFIGGLQDVPERDVPECLRTRLLELRRALTNRQCLDDSPAVVKQTSNEVALVDESSSSSSRRRKRSKRPAGGAVDSSDVLNDEEMEFVRNLMRMRGKLSRTQKEALNAVREGSPELYRVLEQEIAAEQGEIKYADVILEGMSGTSGLAGEGLPRWNRPMLFDPNTNDNIYIAIVSYRDPQCGQSIVEAFARASNPGRVFVGVVQQNRESDLDCFETYCSKAGSACRPNQVRVIRMKDTDSQGVMLARWLASTLWSGERWYLQIDAHSGFNYAWDDLAIDSIKRTGDERAILSHHPPDMALWPKGMGSSVINICRYKWDDTGLPRFSSIMISKPDKPVPNVFIGAGMVFGRAQFIVDCPFDHYLTFLFSGEELLLSVCLFTKGWNIYNPDVLPVWHYYTRNIAGRENPSINSLRDNAILRLKYELGLIDAQQVPRDFLRDIRPYLMGSVRSRESYWEYSGIDWKTKSINEPFCSVEYNPDRARLRYKHHYEKIASLPPLDSYKFDTVPMVPVKYKTTAAPKSQYLLDVAKPDPVLTRPRLKGIAGKL